MGESKESTVKVVIIGKGRGWEKAPYSCEEDEFETWGITQLILQRPVDTVIDMNQYEDGRWGEEEKEKAHQSRVLANLNGIPYFDLQTYPIKDIIAMFGVDYFGCTVDYALALAIYSGFTTIHLYGVNMETDGEYQFEKPGVEFWVGQAMGRGIDVVIYGKHSTLLKTRDGILYGYDIKQKEREE